MKSLFLMVFMLSLVGCTSVGTLKTRYEQHDRMFSQQNPYLEHWVPRGDDTLYAREYNVQFRGKAPTLLLMHGFPDSMHLYDELIPYLRHRHVVTFDFLGWGGSDKPHGHDYTSESLYEDIETIVEYFGLEMIVAVLHDASGPPGIDWALAHPERISKLVLLNTYYQPMEVLVPPEAIARFSTPGIDRDVSIWMTTNFTSVWIDGFSEQIGRFMMDDDKKQEYVNLLAYQSLQSREAFFGLNRVLLEEMDARRDRIGLTTSFPRPVSIVFGDDDPYLNRDVAKAFTALFPHASLILIPDAGHYVQIDRPEKVSRAILAP